MARGDNAKKIRLFLLIMLWICTIACIMFGERKNVKTMPLNGNFIIGTDTVKVDSGIVNMGGKK